MLDDGWCILEDGGWMMVMDDHDAYADLDEDEDQDEDEYEDEYGG